MVATTECPSAEVSKGSVQKGSATKAPAQQWRDEFIYELVKFEGKSQGWVARELGISQGTVSRALRRHERRQVHAEAQDEKRLDPEERLRVQRWLTYERNERILASCLRIATDVEGFVDVSKSTISRNNLAGAENEVRTVHATLDRSGTASRFLRLAFRINMEQLKLVEMEPQTPLPPLSSEELQELNSTGIERDEEVAPRERGRAELQLASGRESPDGALHAHSAHKRITDEGNVSTDLPCTYRENGQHKKDSDERRMASEPSDPGAKSNGRPKRVVQGGMPRDLEVPSMR